MLVVHLLPQGGGSGGRSTTPCRLAAGARRDVTTRSADSARNGNRARPAPDRLPAASRMRRSVGISLRVSGPRSSSRGGTANDNRADAPHAVRRNRPGRGGVEQGNGPRLGIAGNVAEIAKLVAPLNRMVTASAPSTRRRLPSMTRPPRHRPAVPCRCIAHAGARPRTPPCAIAGDFRRGLNLSAGPQIPAPCAHLGRSPAAYPGQWSDCTARPAGGEAQHDHPVGMGFPRNWRPAHAVRLICDGRGRIVERQVVAIMAAPWQSQAQCRRRADRASAGWIAHHLAGQAFFSGVRAAAGKDRLRMRAAAARKIGVVARAPPHTPSLICSCPVAPPKIIAPSRPLPMGRVYLRRSLLADTG